MKSNFNFSINAGTTKVADREVEFPGFTVNCDVEYNAKELSDLYGLYKKVIQELPKLMVDAMEEAEIARHESQERLKKLYKTDEKKEEESAGQTKS